MDRLLSLEIDNFKTYSKHHFIGPFKDITAIIGPNGSGKSNLMDAISFGLGESVRNLRVRKVQDLIHGAHIDKPSSITSSVTMNFQRPTRNQKLSRHIIGNHCEYKIDSKSVSHADYLKTLAEIGIQPKAKNFLVFQGQVEAMALRSPKEMTELFEELSGSKNFKQEYDKLSDDLEKAETKVATELMKRNYLAKQRKSAKKDVELANKKESLKEQLDRQEVDLNLLELKYIESNILEIEKERIAPCKRDISEVSKEIACLQKSVTAKKSELGPIAKQVKQNNDSLVNLEAKALCLNRKQVVGNESVSYSESRLRTAQRVLDQACKAQNASDRRIKTYEHALDEIDRSRQAFELSCSPVVGCTQPDSVSISESIDRRQSVDQLQSESTYFELKETADRSKIQWEKEMEELSEAKRVDENSLADYRRQMKEINSKIDMKTSRMDLLKNRVDSCEEKRRENERITTIEQGKSSDFRDQLETSTRRRDEINKDLEAILQDIKEADIVVHESHRQARKRELIVQIKDFEGVHGRLLSHVRPVHKKYAVALAKVLAKNMDAIVVNTAKTAEKCINYMREQAFPPETFIPLDIIHVKPINETLRDIREPYGVKMLMDVVRYDEVALKKAVEFAIGNTLVAETDEDARRLAFPASGEKHKVVSLRGTLFSKAGIISAGSADLKAKSDCWDRDRADKLKTNKEKLIAELREIGEDRSLVQQADTARRAVVDLEGKHEILSKEIRCARDEIEKIKEEIRGLEKEKKGYLPGVSSHENKLAKVDQKIQEIEQKKASIEDEIFADFCKSVGVENIRVYESRELAESKKRDLKRQEFLQQNDKLRSLIDNEISRNHKKSVQKVEDDIAKIKSSLTLQKENAKTMKEELDGLQAKIQILRQANENCKYNRAEIEKELSAIVSEKRSEAEKLSRLEEQLGKIKMDIERWKLQRHSCLFNCKIKSIDLPLARGDLDHIVVSGESPKKRTSQNIYRIEDDISIDFSRLSLSSLSPGGYIEEASYLSERQKINDNIRETKAALQSIQVLSNMGAASDQLEALDNTCQLAHKEYDEARKAEKEAEAAFKDIKKQRLERFQELLNFVSSKIDQTYKDITNNSAAQALIMPENEKEPYLGGLSYCCIAPGKRYRPMEGLSGGEKTLAALALIFTTRFYHPAPFFVMDEVDAALDQTNLRKFRTFLRKQSGKGCQAIVITLNDDLFSYSDALIGVYPELRGLCISSHTLSLDLTKYLEEPEGDSESGTNPHGAESTNNNSNSNSNYYTDQENMVPSGGGQNQSSSNVNPPRKWSGLLDRNGNHQDDMMR